MKAHMVNNSIRNGIFSLSTFVAKTLPLWEEAESTVVYLPLLALPVSQPVNYVALPPDFAKNFISVKHTPPRRIFILKNVCVNGRAVVFKNMRVFTPSLPWLHETEQHRHSSLLLKQWSRRIPSVPDTAPVALTYDNWAACNYYHWIVESLPRLLMIQQVFPECMILVPDPAPEYIHATIKLLGLTNIYPFQRHPEHVVKVKRLLLPELVYYYEEEEKEKLESIIKKSQKNKLQLRTSNHLPQAELIVTVREKLLQHFKIKAGPPSRKIYISRLGQKTRRLQNESAALPVLAKHGFEVVYFEKMSFREQVELMLDTAVLAGVHGANMVNTLFMQQGTKVVELMNEAHFNEAYYLLTSSIGVAYYSLPCQMADASIKATDDRVILNDANLEVDLVKLEETIRMAVMLPHS